MEHPYFLWVTCARATQAQLFPRPSHAQQFPPHLFPFREFLKGITKRPSPLLKKHNPHLLLHALDLSPDPLDHAVELRDLDLGVLEAVPVLARGCLQLLVLVG